VQNKKLLQCRRICSRGRGGLCNELLTVWDECFLYNLCDDGPFHKKCALQHICSGISLEERDNLDANANYLTNSNNDYEFILQGMDFSNVVDDFVPEPEEMNEQIIEADVEHENNIGEEEYSEYEYDDSDYEDYTPRKKSRYGVDEDDYLKDPDYKP
jgi:hypothetical protein